MLKCWLQAYVKQIGEILLNPAGSTPLMYLNKKETWHMAAKLGCLEQVVLLSHTCYNGNREKFSAWGYGCGECPACKLRENGYNEFVN